MRSINATTGQTSSFTPIQRLTGVILACLLFLPTAAFANDEAVADSEDGSIHWAYGSFLGTGWYKVSGDRKAFVLNIPLSWDYQTSGWTEDGKRQTGIEFKFPVTLGLAQIQDISSIVSADNFSTISFTPGIELEIPLSKNWLLRPYILAGWGKEAAGDESAWIYESGVKARYALAWGNGSWAWLNAVQFAGYSPSTGKSSDMLNIMTGIENSQKLGDWSFNNNQLYLDWHFTYNRFSDPASFRRNGDDRIEVSDFWEAAAAISFGDKPIRILGLNFDQLGFAYQISSDNEYRAIKLSLKSPFLQ